METKDLNSIGLAYLQMVEKKNTEAKKNHADALHKNQKALDVHSDEDEDHNDDPTDGDGDIDAADLKKLRTDADKDDKKFDKKKKSSKKDDDDDQEKFKAYTGDDKNDQEGTKVSEDKEDKFEPHMMYDPKTGKGYKAEKEEDHLRMKKMGYTHDKPEEIDEAMTMVSRKPHPEGGHIVTLKDKDGKKVVRHLHKGKVKTISKESVEIDEAKNITTKDNALVSFYQIHSASPKPRLAGHMNMEVLGGQHQMSAADIKNISNQAVKAGVGKMVKVDNSMLTKHIADYKNENRPAPPKIAVALSQHHAKSLDESTDLQEGAARQAALAKGLMDYCKEIGKDHMDHKDFMDHVKHVKAGNWDKARAHADDQDTEVREKIHTLAIDHLGQGAASELYGGDRKLSKNKGDGKLHASYNESVNVDDVLALIDQGYTLDQAEAMVAEACGGGGGGGGGGAPTSLVQSRKHPDDKKLLKASRKQSKAGDTAPVRPGTKQNQRDFDKAARMAKSKDKVSVAKAPWESVEVDEGYGSMVSPENRARIKARVDANMDKLSAGQKKIAKQTPPRHKITDKDLAHLRTKGHANSPQKESVMDRVSNMVEDIRVDIQEKMAKEGKLDEVLPAVGAIAGGVARAAMSKGIKGAATRAGIKSVAKSAFSNEAEEMAKESVQEAAKPTAIHHSTPVTAAQANDEQAAGRWTDKAGRNTMTEKEFVDMHTIHPDVLPEFDGNVAAKKTAEAIKKAPKAAAKTPNTPTSTGDQKIMPDPTPYGGPAVKTESYMDKYAKYIRGEI